MQSPPSAPQEGLGVQNPPTYLSLTPQLGISKHSPPPPASLELSGGGTHGSGDPPYPTPQHSCLWPGPAPGTLLAEVAPLPHP